jgi:hypothetical protein
MLMGWLYLLVAGCPFFQTKVLRTLQYFPLPEGAGAQKQLHDVLQLIFNGELLASL